MVSNLHTDLIYQYSEEHSTPHSALLAALYRETNLKTLKPRMISGPLQGRLLSMISKLKRPKYIVEIGTFTGYAALCLAEGLTSEGNLITIEVNGELSHISQKYFQQSDYAEQIKCLVGSALDIVPTLDDGIDLVFIDAKKIDYLRYYEDILPKVAPGGILLADNILWDGKVVDASANDKTTVAIKAFNRHVVEDQRVENMLLPLRDGVQIIIKK